MDIPNQAQAGSEEQKMVVDPLDLTNTPNNGTQDAYADYDADVAKLLTEEPNGQGEAPAADFTEHEDLTPADSEDNPGEEISDEQDEPATTPDRFRIRAKDDVEKEALSLRKRHPDWTLKDCLAKAEQILGVAGSEGSQEHAESAGERETVASVTARIEELRAQMTAAQENLEFETAAQLFKESEQLRDRRDELRVTEAASKAQAAEQERQAFFEEYAKHERIALAHYPSAADPNSPLSKRMAELEAQMLELDDPNYYSPRKPLLLARDAARDVGVLMVRPSQNPPGKPSSSTSPFQPASGNRRTTAATTAASVEQAIDGLNSLEDYNRFIGKD